MTTPATTSATTSVRPPPSPATRSRARRRRGDTTPDSHSFPTRPYDLVKEFGIALVVMAVLTVVLAAVFSSPDDHAISLQRWAKEAPNDVVATATAELAGTSTSAGYGAPYNTASDGQKQRLVQPFFDIPLRVSARIKQDCN